jgi:hypothetical protein
MTKQEEVTNPKAGTAEPPTPVEAPVEKPVEEPKKRGFLGGR